jgi:hypothetical protein
MRTRSIGSRTIEAATILGLFGALVPLSGALAQIYRGNDTGGLISWSCESEAAAPQIAADACARYNKYARITQVHRQYGDFITYRCLWSPRVDIYATPAVATRAYCPPPNGAPAPYKAPPPWEARAAGPGAAAEARVAAETGAPQVLAPPVAGEPYPWRWPWDWAGDMMRR